MIDYKNKILFLEEQLKKEFKRANFTKAVIGISGGIDSAVVAVLATRALGSENVHGILMPYSKIKASINEDVDDAKALCEQFDIDYHIHDITTSVDIFTNDVNIVIDEDNKLNSYDDLIRRGNIMARTRMMALFDYSSYDQSLVLGTCNKSENAVGYATIFGDSASSIDLIASLYKTDIIGIAKELGIPMQIISKNPSARLWDGQDDSKELGMDYDRLDTILKYIFDIAKYRISDRYYPGYAEMIMKNTKDYFINNNEITGVDIEIVISLINKNAFKMEIPILI